MAQILQVVGAVVGAVSQSNALRAQAIMREREGKTERGIASRQFRRDIGQQAVEAAGTGLLTGSFNQIFEQQAIEDARFLGRMRQQTAFEVGNLRKESANALVGGAFSAVSGGLGGFGQQKAQSASVRSAKQATPGARLRPGRNPFGPNRGTFSRGLSRDPFTATFN